MPKLGTLRSIYYMQLCVMLLLFLPVMVVYAQSPLAPALNFNVFVMNGASIRGSETQGPVAVGGNLTLRGDHTVASHSAGTFKVGNTTIGLLVGRKVNYQNGNQFNVNNNAYVKIGDCTGTKVWYKDENGASSNIQITGGKYNSNPRINLQTNANNLGVSESVNPVCENNLINFDQAFSRLQANSMGLSYCPNNVELTEPNGKPIYDYDHLPNQVRTVLKTGINILNIDGDDLNGIQQFKIEGARPDANHILIININEKGHFRFKGIKTGDLGSGEAPYVLYNFYNTTDLELDPDDQLPGSVLAPFADITKSNGRNLIGQIIGQSFNTDDGSQQYALFAGNVASCSGGCNKPTVPPITGEDELCKGKTTYFSNTASGGVWSSDNNAIATVDNSGIVTAISAGTANISYSVTNDCGTTKVTKSILVKNLPAKPVITAASSTEYCPGGSVVLTSTPSAGYQWYRDGKKLSDGLSQSYTATIAGRYSVNAINAEGCFSAVAANSVTTSYLEQPSKPTISVSGSPVVCSGQTVLLSSSAPSGNQWYKEGIAISEANSTSYSASTPGLYTVRTTGNKSGCISEASNGVTVNMTASPSPSPITGGSSVCAGSTLALSNNTAGGGWASSNESVAVVDYFTGVVRGLQEGVTVITYSVTNATGCTGKVSQQVIVNSSPSVSPIAGAGTVGVGRNIQLTNSTPAGVWSSSNNAVATVNTSGLVTGVSAGNANIIYTVSNASGCTAPTSLAMVVSNPPNAGNVILGQSSLCVNATTTASNSTPGGVWSSSNAAVANINSVGVVTGVAPGSAEIRYTVTDNNGISSMSSSVISVKSTPSSPVINTDAGTNTICPGGSIVLSSNIATGNRWYKNGVYIPTGNGQQNYTVVEAGTYYVTTTSTDGCESSPSVGYEVLMAPPVVTPSITVSGASTVCSGNSVVLRSSVASGNQWYRNGQKINGATGQTYAAATTGNYTVTATSGQCTSSTSNSISITVNVLPAVPTISAGGPASFCQGNNVLLTAAVSGAVTGYQWLKDNVVIPGATAATYSATASGTYKVTVSNSSGCSSSSATGIIVTVNALPALPTISAGGATTFCAGGNVVLTSSSATGNSWFKDGVYISTGNGNSTYTATASGNYTVSVTNGSGCVSTSTATAVTVNSLPAKPVITTNDATTFCDPGSALLTSSSATGNQWYRDGIAIGGATASTYSANIAGSYTVVVTSAGCSSPASDGTVITVNIGAQVPTIFNISPTTFCAGGSVILVSSSSSNNQWFESGNPIGGATGRSYTATSSGSYTVQVTNVAGCVSGSSAARPVTVNAVPVVTAITGTTSVCVNATTTLANATGGGTWTSSNNGIATVNTTTGLVTGVSGGTATISYSVTNGSGCTTTVTTIVTVNSLPSLSDIVGAGSVCTAKTITLSPTIPGGVWSSSDNSIATVNASSGVVTGVAAGSVTISYTLTNGNGCASSNTHTVTVNATPVVAAITGAASVCAGKTITLSNATAGGVWSSNDTSVAVVSSNGVVTGIAAGTAQIIYTVSNSSGCSNQVSAIVTVNAVPVVARIMGANAVCVGSSTQLTNSTPGGVWSSNNTSVATINSSGLVAGVSAGSVTIHYTVTNGFGCQTTVSGSGVVNGLPSQPVVSANGPTTFCENSSVSLSATPEFGYQWLNNGVPIANTNTQNYLATVTGNYTVQTTNQFGCSSPLSAATAVTANAIPATPVVSAAGAVTFCSGGSVTLNSTAVSGNQWYRNGLAITGATGTSYLATTSGSYTVVATSVNSCSSAVSNSITVSVTPLPLTPGISAGSASSFCDGGSVLLTSTAVSGNQWYKDGNPVTGATGQTYSATTAGVYTVRRTSNNCVSAVSNGITVTVFAMPPTPVVSSSGATTVCIGNTVTLTSNAATGNQWYRNNSLIQNATGQSFDAVTTGNYAVRVTTGNGCSSASVATAVTVNAKPFVAAITGDNSICINTSSQLTSATAGGGWSSSNTSIATISSTGLVTGVGNGNATISYTVTNSSGCSTTVTTVITVNATPSVPLITAQSATTFCNGGAVLLVSSSSSGNQWLKDGVLIDSATDQQLLVTVAGAYTVAVINASGCISNGTSAAVVVTVNPLPGQPTISSNGSTSFCSGGNVVLTSSASSGNQWYSGNIAIAGATGTTYTATAAGTYTVISTNGSGCASVESNSSTVNVIPLPSQPFISAESATTFCSGDSVILTSNSLSGNQWYKDGQVISGAVDPNYVATASGTYTVVVTSIAGCNSSASNSIAVTVNSRPTLSDIIGNSNVCEGGTSTLSNNTPGGMWSSSNPAFALVHPLLGVLEGLNYGSATIYYTVINGNGCSSVTQTDIRVNIRPVKPELTANGPLSFCQSGSVQLSSSGANGYQWYRNGSIIAGAVSKEYIASTSGSYTVVVTGITGCASLASNAVIVTVNQIPAIPVITAGGTTTICANDKVRLTSSATSGNQWYRNGILLQGIVSQGGETAVAGIYTVTTTNNSGCTSPMSAGVTVVVNPLPTVARITGPKSICTGGTATLENATTGGVWSSGDNTIATINSTTGLVTGVSAGPITVGYTVTDGNGCSTTVSAAGFIRATPAAPEISNETATAFCAGGSVALISSSSVGNQWFKDGNSIPGANGQVYTANTSGVYTVTVTGGTGCVANGSSEGVEVLVFSLPVVNGISGSNSVCVNSTTQLTNSTTGGQWSSGNEDIATINNTGLVTGLGAGNTTIRYTVTNSNGCSVFVSFVLTVNPLQAKPTVSAGSTTVFCAGSAVVLTATAATGYQWYKNGTIITAATTQTYTANSAGSYSVITTNASGCSSPASDQLVVTVNTIPAVPVITTGGPVVFCLGNQVVLTSNTSGSNQWYRNGTLIPGTTAQTYTASATGSYTVTTTNAAGCVSIASAATVVTVNTLPPKPTITPSGTVNLCQGDSTTVTSSAATGNQWYKNGIAIAGATKNTLFGSATGKFTVTVTDANGCAASSDTVTGNVLARPALLPIDGSKTICQNDSAQWSNATTGGVWSSSNATVATVGSNGLVKGVSAGSASITYRVTYQNGCSISTSSVVTINAKPVTPVVTTSGVTTFCHGNNVTLTSNASTGNTWYNNGVVVAGATGSSYIVSSSGSYYVTASNVLTGCTSGPSASTNVVVNSLPATPVITATGPTSFCAGDSVLLSSSATLNQWYINDTLIVGATAATYKARISANYSAIAINSNGCRSLVSNRLPVNAVPLPEGKILGSSVQLICTDSSLILQAVGGNTYRWYNNNQLIAGATDDSLFVKTAGSYRAVLVGELGCEAPVPQSVTVQVIQKPVVNYVYDAYCAGKIVNLQSTSDVSQSGPVIYFWTDGFIVSKFSSSAPSYIPSQAGTFKAMLRVTPFYCPAAADSIIKDLVIVSPAPALRMTPVDVMINDPVQLQARTNIGTSYLWTPATFLSSSTIANPVVRATAEQQYIIRMTAPSTCETNDTLLVRIHSENTVSIPTVFSPNGDGLNDKLFVNYVGIRELKVFRIYNRWGRRVFESRNLAEGWDGSFGYEKMPMDSYTWMIEAVDKNGNMIRKQGTVTLLR